MGDPVSLVVGPIVDMVIRHATSLISQNFHLLWGVEEEIGKLSSELTTIQSVLDDAEARQLESQQLRDWLGKLQEVSYDAQDILETFATEASLWQQKKQQQVLLSVPLSANQAAFKLDAARKIKQLLARLVQIAEEKDKFHLNAQAVCVIPPYDRNTDFHVDESGVVGREDDKNEIIQRLVSEEFDKEDGISVIPIIGMGGMGKTTVAQLVYNDDRVKNHFEFLMWVCVTDIFDHRRILKEMIEYHSEMKYDINSLSDRQLHSRLLEFLVGRRFLLVLDDVWTESYEDWERIQSLLKSGGKGCRVLVTSRSAQVSNVMGTQLPYPLGYLPEDQCWSLFQKIAFKECDLGDSVDGELEDIGRKIVRKCEGLPLAVKAMGGLLRGNKDVQKWRKILEHKIWEAEELNITSGKPKVLPALKLSYNHLPSHLKQCFAYCYIFPKAYVFRKTELVKIWKAASLVQSRGQDSTDEIGSDYFDDLLTRSFFQLVEVDREDDKAAVVYRMHDLIHDLAGSVSSPHCCQVKDKDPCSHISERSRHVSLLCKEAEQPVREVTVKSRKLRTLLSPTEYLKEFGQALDNLFLKLKYVRVLDLSSSTILELPKSVGELKLLRYLDLSRTEIRMLPNSICGLYNLQTLKLLGCLWLFELPKDLGNLVNLQHLELDDMFWYKLYILPQKIGSLTRLQNLHAFPVGQKKGYGVEELGAMMYLTGTLHILQLENAVNAGEAKLKDKGGLKKVVFEWSINRDGRPQDEAANLTVLEDLQPHSNLEELQVFHYKGTGFPSWLRGAVVPNLVRITLNHCTKCKVLSLVGLPHLRVLYIKGLLELEEWPEGEYNYLSRLKISNCPKLRELPRCFLNLGSMKIKGCSSLTALPVTPSMQFLILIDNFVLQDWNEVGLSLLSGGQAKIVPSFINVLELIIKNCSLMPKLPAFFAPQKLEISACPLVTLPVPEFAKRLHHLAIDACSDGDLVSTIPETSSLSSLIISKISILKYLPQWPHLPALKSLYIHQCEDLESLADEGANFQVLNSLKTLSIQNCSKLVTLPVSGLPPSLGFLSIGSCSSLKFLGPEGMLKNLASLEDLYIENCPAVQLPEEGLPPSLKHLHISGCPLLTEQCQKDKGPYWPKIMDIPILEFDSIGVSSALNSPILEVDSIGVASALNSPMKTTAEASSARWYRHFTCCKGFVIREAEEPQEGGPYSSMQITKGETSKGKEVP